MIYHLLFCFVTFVLDVFGSVRVAPAKEDLQIDLLRQQVRILERNSKTKPRLSHSKKLMLVTLATRLKAQTQRFHEASGLCRPNLRTLPHPCRENKFAGSFDWVFVSDGFEIVRTPFRAPKANAVAERWWRSNETCFRSLMTPRVAATCAHHARFQARSHQRA